MLSQTDAVKQAWAAADRTLDIIVTVDGKDYQATEINSLNYDAGAFTGDTLGIGSAYENSVTIEFSSVVEAFKQGLTVLPKVGILVDGKFEYTKLGTFIISEVNRDRNNNLTTIKALDQMCKLEGQYKPTVSAMASPLDIIADIANQGGVAVNTGELQHLPTLPNIKKIEGQTLRTAIGWVAQLYGGFAAFDRDGKLTIRTAATPDYTITPGEYQQGGLTKNEVAYKTGGIKVTVNTKKTDDSGQEVGDTTTLQAGETTGSQIELTNDSMTSDLLTTVWTGIKDITYYPYTLNWFGNPNLEAGDWATLTDTQGNKFNVPINKYTMSFNGGLESTISATQSSSTAGGYSYTGSAGSIKNMIEALQARHTASGNNVYPPSYQGQPKNPKKGDVWYKQNGNNVEVWIYQDEDGKLSWVRTPLDGEVKADLQAMGKKIDEDLTRVKSELSSEAESQWKSMKADTSKVANDLSSVKTSLADTKNSLTTTTSKINNDLTGVKNSLEDTKNSLTTTVSDLQKQTGQLSGSLSTANSKIEFNSNAIAEVKRTAGEISTIVSNIRVGDRNIARGNAGGKDWFVFDSFNGAINRYIDLVAYSLSTLKAGDKVTFGITMKNEGVTSGTMIFQQHGDATVWNRDYGSIAPRVNIVDLVPDGTEKALTYTIPITTGMLNGNSSYILQIRTDNVPAGGKLSFRYAFVKKGTMASDWTPAPEDTDQAISKVSQTADAIRADLTNTKGDVASVKATANSLQSQITDNKNNISSVKQTATTLQSSLSNAQGEISNVKQTANKLQSDLTNAKGDISSLQQTASGLTSRVGNAEGNISQLQQTARGLQSTVADQSGKISTLQHTADGLNFTVANGSQNLILNSGNPSTLEHWSTTGRLHLQKHFFWKNGTENLFVLSNTSSTNEKVFSSERFQIEPNQTYTLSFYAFNNIALKNADVWYLPRKAGSSNFFDTAIQLATSVRYPENHAQYNKITFNSGNYNECYIRFDNNCSTTEGTSADLWLTDIQLEKGSIATAWHPSSGDIAQLKITADGLKATVGDDNTGLVSYVKEIPGQISSAITASKQATVITSAVDLHNMKKAGYYLLKGALTNSPVTPWAFLRVITSDSGDRIYHRIWKDNGSTVYTEEWTGSWSVWSTHINSDNLKSNVITAINQSTEGVSITGAKITLDGDVNIAPGFTLSADYIKAGTLKADRISGGTLDFSKFIIGGLTANSISSGSISGRNLNINLDNGVVEFTKGNLHSTDGRFNINIDNKSFYLDTGSGSKLRIDNNGFHLQESATQHLWMNKDGLHNYTDANKNGILINDTELKVLNSKNAGLVAKDGMLQFCANPIWNSDNVYSGNLNSQLYGTIGFNSNLLSSSLNGIFIKGREGVVIGTSSYDGGTFLSPGVYLDVGQAGAGINLPDALDQPASMFTKAPLVLLGGPTYNDSSAAKWTRKAQIDIGCNLAYTHNRARMEATTDIGRGNQIYAEARNVSLWANEWINLDARGRVAIQAQYFHSYPTYNKTTSAGANVYVAPDGALVRSSSARKYKTDIQDADNDYGAKLVELTPQKWIDKAEKKRYEEDPENNKKPGYYYGLIADDLDAAGLDMLVNYGAEGEVEGINYDRLAVALLPVIKSLKDQVASLKEQIKALTK